MNPGAGTEGTVAATVRGARGVVRWFTPYRILWAAVIAFFVVSFSLSWVRAIELQTTTWDQGVYQQALWSTAHGRPFYETPDVETGGYGSLLDVHSVFLFYLIVPLYNLLPYEATLFAVQSAVVGIAAVPLYFLARDLTSSPRLGLLAGVAYLTWTPVLSSVLYDFHPEAFLPAELFTLALLWERQRFGAGFAIAVLSFTTFELAPVLTFFFGAFGLISVRVAPTNDPRRSDGRSRLRRSAESLRAWFAIRKVRWSLGLMVASGMAYAALLYLRVDFLTPALGTYPLTHQASGYVIGATPATLGLSLAHLPIGIVAKLSYWLIALALLAFVPLLSPRALILGVPWFAFTLLSPDTNYVTIGFQYGFIVACALLPAFAYGLPRARRWVERYLARSSRGRPTGPGARAGPPVPRARRVAVVLGLAGLLAVNLALTPLDPALQNIGLGSSYRLSYSPAPGDAFVAKLAGLVPPGATVVASDDLFPLVVNNPNAYSFFWTENPVLALPFDPSHLPQYVFLAGDRTAAVPAWLTEVLYDRSVYGVRGLVWSSDVGPVLLFEVGYAGPPTELGALPELRGSYSGATIAAPPAGLVGAVGGSTYPTVVESAPGAAGVVLFGPGSALPSGNYTVALSLRVAPLSGHPVPGAADPVLRLRAMAFANPALYGHSTSFGPLNGSNWTIVTFPLRLGEPIVQFDVQGVLLDPSVELTVNYLMIQPATPGSSGGGG